MDSFVDSTGKIWRGRPLQIAIDAVFKKYYIQALRIRTADDYPPHVTARDRERFYQQAIDRIENFRPTVSFYQELNFQLTGECVAILS